MSFNRHIRRQFYEYHGRPTKPLPRKKFALLILCMIIVIALILGIIFYIQRKINAYKHEIESCNSIIDNLNARIEELSSELSSSRQRNVSLVQQLRNANIEIEYTDKTANPTKQEAAAPLAVEENTKAKSDFEKMVAYQTYTDATDDIMAVAAELNDVGDMKDAIYHHAYYQNSNDKTNLNSYLGRARFDPSLRSTIERTKPYVFNDKGYLNSPDVAVKNYLDSDECAEVLEKAYKVKASIPVATAQLRAFSSNYDTSYLLFEALCNSFVDAIADVEKENVQYFDRGHSIRNKIYNDYEALLKSLPK